MLTLVAGSPRAVRDAAWRCVQDTNDALSATRRIVFCVPECQALWRQSVREASENGAMMPRFGDLEAWFRAAVDEVSARNWVAFADRQFILRDVLHGVSRRLGPLRGLCNSSDMVRQLDAFIADLRRADVERVPPSGDWSHDLQLILDAYNYRLNERDAVDAERAPLLFARLNPQQQAHAVRRLDAAIFDGIIAPSPALWSGIEALLQVLPHSVAILMAPLQDAPQTPHDLHRALKGTVLERVATLWADAAGADAAPEARVLIATQASAARRHAAHALLHRASSHVHESPAISLQRAPKRKLAAQPTLFDVDEPAPLEAPSDCTLTTAHTPRDEMGAIAATIRARLHDGALIDSLVVALPDPARYAGVLEAAFAAHDLPIRIERARPWTTFAGVRRVLQLFALCDASNEWQADELCDGFGDGLLQWRAPESQAAFDAHRLRRACIQARRPSLRDCESARAALCPETLEADEIRSALESDFDCLRHLQAECARFHEPMRAEEWRDAARQLLASATPPEAPTEAHWQREAVNAAIERVAERAMRWSSDLPRRTRDFFDWLRADLENPVAPLEMESQEAQEAVRIVGTRALSGGVGARELFLAGLIEGDWPDASLPGALVARHQNEFAALRAHRPDAGLLALHQLAVALEDAEIVHLSHPLWRDGREVLRSPVVEDWLDAWPETPALIVRQPASRMEALRFLGRLESVDFAAHDLLDGAHLETVARLRQERKSTNIGLYDGGLGEAARPQIAAWQKRRHGLRVEHLRAYAECGWKFFGREVLGLRAPRDWQDDLHPGARGQLLHAVLERFHRAQAVSNEAAWPELRRLASAEIARLPLRPILREAETLALLGAAHEDDAVYPGGILGRVLKSQNEVANDWAHELRPLSDELAPFFNNGAGWDFALHFDDETVVVGHLDQIVQPTEGQMLLVIDWHDRKRSGLPPFAKADAGLDFGLPLALFAARQKWRDTPANAFVPMLAGAHFSLREARFGGRIGSEGTLSRKPRLSATATEAQMSPARLNAWLDASVERARLIARLISLSQFALAVHPPDVAGCAWCDLRMACRRDDEVQAARHTFHLDGASNAVYLSGPLLPEGDES